MKFLDFFSGIGGFRLGMEQNGHECVGHCEIDIYADKSYRAMHDVKGSEFYANDIIGIMPGDLPEADCYCGGFPCQSFSIAGKRGGFNDTRGTLFFEVMRLARVRKPKYLFLENVKGLLSHDGGRTFGTIIAAMGECGYDAEWQVCNSKNFGVPQNRERIFIIGHLRGSSGRQVFPIISSGEKNLWVSRQSVNCITARYGTAESNGSYIIESKQPTQDGRTLRKLTPRECFRLQGFPDDYFDRAAEVNLNSQLYQQAGNSVTVPVIKAIAERMVD